MTVKPQKPTCALEPIHLDNPNHFAKLQTQRQLCGWDHEITTLKKWATKQREGLKSLFWIAIPDPSITNINSTIYVGHIALDAYADPPDPDLARADKSILTVHSFFIMPEYRALRLGRRAMALVEEMAVEEPRCRLITLTALSKRYMYEEGPEGRGIWARIGMDQPAFSIQEWYEKGGYVAWKEGPLYEASTVDGGVVVLWEAFMRKEVRVEGCAERKLMK
ncbi:uncharacterized protein ACLA_061570 [Aspergillus clavatus NRRL 1]|uniref:N-acetyltransferase domain-containing protein n=1 Tax=Aspergillus clavatus (strain ATCC 1007 / CBS 513.65 / DSM 816 / NCTC 3887 / NRRL 1 / QM 1276 / 107) TaxID=344612 RepID=A1CCD8_ASPCL|nr:uncharacterized protein ACLA_061570 [Aspergillus clavatus NRRL 1]EAW12195.1 conserved hypothetical protein [Aspergillus clavatus NRRL 1]